jgi:hypothetical protein
MTRMDRFPLAVDLALRLVTGSGSAIGFRAK